jgi:hypothetical protein
MARTETINSNDKKLPSPEIIVKTLEQIGSGDHPLATALAIIAKEGTLDTADIVQFGNTVFLANRGVGANKNKMVGRAFNVDTGKNYLSNCLEYLRYLHEKGITHYTTTFEGPEVLKLMQLLQKLVEDIDTDIYIGRAEDGSYIGYCRLGKDPLPKDI